MYESTGSQFVATATKVQSKPHAFLGNQGLQKLDVKVNKTVYIAKSRQRYYKTLKTFCCTCQIKPKRCVHA